MFKRDIFERTCSVGIYLFVSVCLLETNMKQFILATYLEGKPLMIKTISYSSGILNCQCITG